MKLAIITIVLIDITIAVIWFYRPSYPTAQAVVRLSITHKYSVWRRDFF